MLHVYVLGSQHIQLIVMTTEYTQSGKGRFFGVHSIMMENSAMAAKGGGGARLPPLTLLYLPSRTKLQCTLKKQIYTLLVFHLYPVYILW